MKTVLTLLLILAAPAFAAPVQLYAPHFGVCKPFELTGKHQTTMCNGHDQTVCVNVAKVNAKILKGWTLGKCGSSQDCGDGICDPSIGENCSDCPADCAPSTVCCQNGMGGTVTENCCDDCSLDTVQCIEEAHSTGPGGSCVPN